MSQAFGVPAFPVDTHIHRLAARWGLSDGSSVVRTEADLKRLFPESSWNALHLQIIFYGREHGKAGTPKAWLITTLAVLCPTPDSFSRSSKVPGTSPPCSRTRASLRLARYFAFEGANPISRMSSRMRPSPSAAMAAGVGPAANSAG